MTPPPASDEGGFTILEILMALAIGALVTMAIGGLLLVTTSLRSRVDETSRVEAALVNIQAAFQRLSSQIDLQVQTVTDVGFTLAETAGERGQSSDPVSVSLANPALTSLVVTSPSPTAMIDLRVFERPAIEYLVASPSGWSWRSAVAAGAMKIVAARLRLQLHQRVWRPLLWIASAYSPVAPA